MDLIEPGDYINGEYVIWVNKYIIHTKEIDFSKEKNIYSEIETIVTKEKFNQVKYEV